MQALARNPILAGGALALVAAIAFGVTTPLIRRFGAEAGPFATAALLYGGAALASLAPASSRETRVRATHVPRLLLVSLLGAIAAPVCLAWGLRRTDATSGSLLLNFEGVLTLLLARAFYREALGSRVVVALVLMLAGGAVLVFGAAGGVTLAGGAVWGLLAVLAASLAWACDNTATRPLADLDPKRVVLVKGSLGAALSTVACVALRESFPRATDAAALLGCGAVGYGVSLRLYLLAQRRIGAARTGSIFAIGPFVGAAVAWLAGERAHTASTIAAGALFTLAIYLHLTELHAHVHTHERLEHEHAHRHDDGHHNHAHDARIDGEHTHVHRHEAREHAHAHGEDVHHRHRH